MSAGSEGPYRERLRATLLRATEAIIADEGLPAAQARRVAKASGCSVGTLYNIFGDIDGLILAANQRTLQDLGRVLTAVAQRAAGGDTLAQLLALAGAYLDFATANQRRWRAVFEHRLPDDRGVPEDYRQDRGKLLALIEAQLETCIPDNAERADAATALFYAVHGIVLLSLDAKLGPFEPAQCERQIRFIVENVISSIT